MSKTTTVKVTVGRDADPDVVQHCHLTSSRS